MERLWRWLRLGSPGAPVLPPERPPAVQRPPLYHLASHQPAIPVEARAQEMLPAYSRNREAQPETTTANKDRQERPATVYLQQPSPRSRTFPKSTLDTASTKTICLPFSFTVAVAQLVRAPDCGSGGRGFKSPLPPHFFPSGRQIRPVPQDSSPACPSAGLFHIPLPAKAYATAPKNRVLYVQTPSPPRVAYTGRISLKSPRRL